MKKIVDLVINIDALILNDDENVDDLIQHIQNRFEMSYEPTWEILYEELIDD